MTDGYGTDQPPESVPEDLSGYPAPPPPPPPPPGSFGVPPYLQQPGGGFQMPYPTSPPPPPYFGTGSKPLANYGYRLGGWLIDWVLLLIISVPVLLVTHSIHHYNTYLTNDNGSVHQWGYNVGAGGYALWAVIVIVYGTVLCGSSRGQTVGMMLVGTRVIDETSGGAIGVPRAFGRAAFEYLMAAVFFIPWVIDMLFPLWDSKNQTLHDKVTRAVVVKL